ncbi:hypothetical protein ACJRO7_030986 [Eucalyptus globulus]|uniref:Chloroplast envelope membrane protein n=1 Tax=Eucalyptus globulus TaxID=34317 RepID=A0ABD3JHD8_EUCGL
MIKEYPKTHLQTLHKETIQLIKMHHEDHIHMILHLSTNITSFIILSGYSILVQEFLYNLIDTKKSFFYSLLTDLFIGFHSPHGWELMIDYVYKDFGFAHNDQIISSLVSTFLVILDTIFKYIYSN